MKTISGFPGFGSPGKEGIIGAEGNSIYYSDYDLSNQDEFSIVQRLIADGRKLLKKHNNERFAREYLIGDFILDFNGDIYYLKNKDLSNNIVDITNIQKSININKFTQDESYNLSINNLLLQKDIPTFGKIKDFYNDYPLTVLYDNDENDNFLVLKSSKNSDTNRYIRFNYDNKDNIHITPVYSNIYVDNLYVPEKSEIINSNSLLFIIQDIIEDMFIEENEIKFSNSKDDILNLIKITELVNYIENPSSSIKELNNTYERIIKNYNEKTFRTLNNVNGYIKIYVKDFNNTIFHIIKINSIVKPNNLVNISADDVEYTAVDNIISVKNVKVNAFNIKFSFENTIERSDIKYISNSNISYQISGQDIIIRNVIDENNTTEKLITRAVKIYNKQYFIKYSNPYYDYSSERGLEMEFSTYANSEAKYLQFNSLKRGIPCNAFLTISSLDIKHVRLNAENKLDDILDVSININYDAITPSLASVFNSELNKKTRISAALVYAKNKENIINDINIEYFLDNENIISNVIRETEFSDSANKKLQIHTQINSKDIYIGDEYLDLINYAPKLLILVEFDEPYFCDVTLNIKGSVNGKNYKDVYNFDKSFTTRVIPWELSAMELLNDVKSVKAYNKLTHPGNVPINLKNLKIEISNYNKKYYNFYNDNKSFYPLDLNKNNTADGLYNDLSLLKYGYKFDNDTTELNFIPEKNKNYLAKSVNYSQFDPDILYPVRSGISISVNEKDIRTQELFFENVNTIGTKYAPLSADGILLGESYVKYDKIKEDINNGMLYACEWTYNKTYRNKEKGNYITYDCKLTNPGNVDLNKFNINDINNEEMTENRFVPYSIFFDIEPRVVIKSPSEYAFDGAVNLLRCPKVPYKNEDKELKYSKGYFKDEEYRDIFKWYIPTSIRTLVSDDTISYDNY